MYWVLLSSRSRHRIWARFGRVYSLQLHWRAMSVATLAASKSRIRAAELRAPGAGNFNS